MAVVVVAMVVVAVVVVTNKSLLVLFLLLLTLLLLLLWWCEDLERADGEGESGCVCDVIRQCDVEQADWVPDEVKVGCSDSGRVAMQPVQQRVQPALSNHHRVIQKHQKVATSRSGRQISSLGHTKWLCRVCPHELNVRDLGKELNGMFHDVVK